MSATIYYRRVKSSPYLKKVGSPSSFMALMEKAGMRLPCELGAENIDVLRGLSAAQSNEDNAFDEIIDLILKHEVIELWAEY